MQRRHSAVVQLYNSESDALEPKSLFQCAQTIMQREKRNDSDTYDKAQAETKVAIALTKLTNKTPPEEIRTTQLAYLRHYQGHFGEIRAQARANMATAAAAAAPAAEPSSSLAGTAAVASTEGTSTLLAPDAAASSNQAGEAAMEKEAAPGTAPTPSPSVRRSPARSAKKVAAGSTATHTGSVNPRSSAARPKRNGRNGARLEETPSDSSSLKASQPAPAPLALGLGLGEGWDDDDDDDDDDFVTNPSLARLASSSPVY